jgi:hypothetical protein
MRHRAIFFARHLRSVTDSPMLARIATRTTSVARVSTLSVVPRRFLSHEYHPETGPGEKRRLRLPQRATTRRAAAAPPLMPSHVAFDLVFRPAVADPNEE